MAYKYVNDNGLKAYTKKVKGALKDLHTPIAISTENTTESQAQNVKNIADFVAKAKAAGITDVNGMAVTYLIDNAYSGNGTLYEVGQDSYGLFGVYTADDGTSYTLTVGNAGYYFETLLYSEEYSQPITDEDLPDNVSYSELSIKADVKGILHFDISTVAKTAKVKYIGKSTVMEFNSITDIEQWSGDVGQLMLKRAKVCWNKVSTGGDLYFLGSYIGDGTYTFISQSKGNASILKLNLPHNGDWTYTLYPIENYKALLTPVLQEIDLTGTDAERKAKLTQFETDWKALTGASDLSGARFVGKAEGPDRMTMTGIFSYADGNSYTGLVCTRGYTPYEVNVSPVFGSLEWVPLFSHLEAVNILAIDDTESKKKNLERLNDYKANLRDLGVNLLTSVQIPFRIGNTKIGTFSYIQETFPYSEHKDPIHHYVGVSYALDTGKVFRCEVDATGKFTETPLALNEDVEQVKTLAQAVNAFGAIELKASDNAANKAALTAYLKILTDAEVSTANGYSVPFRITGNAQEYHGMLNIGTGALLSGIVTDVNENHHYPFNVSTADGTITFDANNYFLEKTSNEVTEMLDAIKYSYTPVPLTATTLSNKAQLEVFLSKVPNAQVMHCTYKDVYAGTLHKINGEWFGLLVKNTNNYEDALQVKLQADGTLIEGTTSLAQVNSKLDTIMG